MSTPISPDDNVEYVNPNPIQPGEVMPTDILCESYQGQPVSIEDLVKTNGLVLFTVPMAGTWACTSQAGAFQAVSEEFNRLGYALCSLSPDEMDAISEWMRDNDEFTFQALADPDHVLLYALGALVVPKDVEVTPLCTVRGFFIFEKTSGRLLDKGLGLHYTDCGSEAVKALKRLNTKSATL